MGRPPVSSSSSSAPLIPDACVRGGVLILSLPDALTPVVWQFDLSNVKASALEVVPGESPAGGHLLRLKTPHGEIHDIARYAAREAAVAVLMKIHAALSADGAGSLGTGSSRSARAEPSPWKLAGAALILLVLGVFILGQLQPGLSDQAPRAGGDSSPGASAVGAPVSADDFLQEPR